MVVTLGIVRDGFRGWKYGSVPPTMLRPWGGGLKVIVWRMAV